MTVLDTRESTRSGKIPYRTARCVPEKTMHHVTPKGCERVLTFWEEVAVAYCRSKPGLEARVLEARSDLAAAQVMKDHLETGWWQRYYMDTSASQVVIKTASEGGRVLGRMTFFAIAVHLRAAAEQLELF